MLRPPVKAELTNTTTHFLRDLVASERRLLSVAHVVAVVLAAARARPLSTEGADSIFLFLIIIAVGLAQCILEGHGLLLVLEPYEDGGTDIVGPRVDVVDDAIGCRVTLDILALERVELALGARAHVNLVLTKGPLLFLSIAKERHDVAEVIVGDRGYRHL